MENSNKNESILIIVFTIILVGIIGIVSYTAYTSTSSLGNNTQNQKSVTQNNTALNTIPNADTEVPEKTTESNIITGPVEVETEIAFFSSNIYDHDLNRAFNIELAIKKINGTIVKKGEIFSFNDTVGPMGEEQGFKEAIGFDNNGKKIKMFGGGMCQISSTIYNAALISNLEIVERHPHSRRVYYVPKDKDATIYYGSLDFKFKNTSDNDIKIAATSDTSNVSVILYKITSGI